MYECSGLETIFSPKIFKLQQKEQARVERGAQHRNITTKCSDPLS